MEYTPHGDLLGFMRTSRGVEDKHHVGEGFVRELSNYDLVTFARQIANGMQFLNSKRVSRFVYKLVYQLSVDEGNRRREEDELIHWFVFHRADAVT